MRVLAPLPWLGLFTLTAATAMIALPDRRLAIRIDAPAVDVADLAVDIWTENPAPDRPLDLVVRERDLGALIARGVVFDVVDRDIDATARAERERIRAAGIAKPGDWYADYKDLAQIEGRLKTLALTRPDLASTLVIGGSLEGRAIRAIRIGHGDKKLLVNGTQHAREWIATMTATCVAERLVTEYEKDPRIKAFVDSTELVLVPVVNPDGYQYAWGTDRYWRKNRRDRHGVDLNRNFSVGWGGSGSSTSKRSEVYRGEYAFSEPESQAMRDLAKRERFAAHIDFHSFGQIVMHPWCYSASRTEHHAKFGAIGDRMASALVAAHGLRYKLARCNGASGTLTDWMYGETGALAMVVELRPASGGRNGFVLPPEQIKPTCDEGLAAVLALRAAL
jgi:carboxypeptidase T